MTIAAPVSTDPSFYPEGTSTEAAHAIARDHQDRLRARLIATYPGAEVDVYLVPDHTAHGGVRVLTDDTEQDVTEAVTAAFEETRAQAQAAYANGE